ncbi:unnamed protein product, partial [Scytosiphon promiscuus]
MAVAQGDEQKNLVRPLDNLKHRKQVRFRSRYPVQLSDVALVYWDQVSSVDHSPHDSHLDLFVTNLEAIRCVAQFALTALEAYLPGHYKLKGRALSRPRSHKVVKPWCVSVHLMLPAQRFAQRRGRRPWKLT